MNDDQQTNSNLPATQNGSADSAFDSSNTQNVDNSDSSGGQAPPIQPVSSQQSTMPTLPPLNPVPGSLPASNSDDSSVANNDQLVAEDVDLIEKEWVAKAKAIINSRSNDPNKLSKDINRIKADYVKSRYSKDLKVND